MKLVPIYFLLVSVFLIALGYFYIFANYSDFLPYLFLFKLSAFIVFFFICFLFYYDNDFQLIMTKKIKPRGVLYHTNLFRVYKGYFKVEYYYLGTDPITRELLPEELKKHPESVQTWILETFRKVGFYTETPPFYGILLFLSILMLACIGHLIWYMSRQLW